MTTQIRDDARESTSFKIAAQKIDSLLKRLNEKRVCPCCTSRALTLHAMHLQCTSCGRPTRSYDISLVGGVVFIECPCGLRSEISWQG
jgi:hypothetical protein